MPLISRYSTTTTGGITFTGNTMGLSQLSGFNQAGTLGSQGAFSSLNLGLQVPTFPPGTTLNINENGSRANLTIPPGSTVLHAELIWGGSYYYQYQELPPNTGTHLDDITALIDQPVKFTPPGGSTVSISPDPLTAQSDGFTSTVGGGVPYINTFRFYERTADVTALVQAAGAGSYAVEQVPGLLEPSQVYNGATNHAGWTLAVIYQNTTLQERSLYLWVGAQIVNASQMPSADIPISGFLTKPAGAINARLLISAQEGDADIPGDQLLFGPTVGSLVPVSGPNNFATNFFGSQINNDAGGVDTTGTFGDRNQSPATSSDIVGGRQSWDITNIDVSAQMLNSQSSAVIRVTTAGDAYMVNGIGLQLDVLKLETPMVKAVDKTLADSGDVLTYTTTITSNSNVTLTNATFTDPIPSGTTFVAGSVTVNGVVQAGANPTSGINIGTITTGQSITIVFKVTVVSVPATNPIPNTAHLSYTYAPGVTHQDQSNTVTTRVNHAQITPVKAVNVAYDQLGQEVTYTTTLTNTGSIAADNVVFTDTVPTGTTFVVGSVSVGGVSQPLADPTVGIPIGTIGVGASVTIVFKVKIGNVFPSPNPIVNTNKVAYQYTVDPIKPPVVIPQVNSNQVTTQINEALLTVTKSVDKAVASFGDVVTYTSVLKNTGNVVASNVVFGDATPSGMTFVPGSVVVNGVSQPTQNPGVGINVGSIAAGASTTVVLQVTVNNSFPPQNPIPNTSGATYAYLVDPNGSPVSAAPVLSNQVLTQINDTNLSIVKSANKTYADVDEVVTYNTVITNSGNIAATNVFFTDTLPVGTTFVSGSVKFNGVTQATLNPQTGFTLPNIAAGGTLQISFSVTINSTLPIPSSVTNIATIKETGAPVQHSNPVTVTINHGRLTAVKQVDLAYTSITGILSYSTVLTNVGNANVDNVVFQDAIPGGTTFVPGSVQINGVTQQSADPSVGIPIGAIVPGGSVPIVFNVQVAGAVPAVNPIPNTANINYSYKVEPTKPSVIAPVLTTNTVNTKVNNAMLNSSKVVDKASADLGDTILYTVVVTNTGNVSADNAKFFDLIPGGTTFVSGSVSVNGAPNVGANPQNGIPLGSIAVGGSVTVAFEVTIDNNIPQTNPIKNESTTTYNYLLDPLGSPITAPPSQSNQVQTLIQHANITTEKAVDLTVAMPGQSINYTIKLTNKGNTAANNVVFKDAIPAGTTFVTNSVTIDGVPATAGSDPSVGVVIGTIAIGVTVTIKFAVLIGNVIPAVNPIINTGSVDYNYLADPLAPPVTAPTVTTNPVATLVVLNGDTASLSMTKIVDKVYALVGDTLTYSINVTNAGTTAALNVVVKDILAGGMTFVGNSIVVDGVPRLGVDIETGVTIVQIDPGQTVVIGFKTKLGNTLPVVNPIPNTAFANYQFVNNPFLPPVDGPITYTNTVRTLVELVYVAGVKGVDKAYADLGQVLTYSVGVANLGTSLIESVVLTDSVPAGTTFLAGTVTVAGVPQVTADPKVGIAVGTIVPGTVKMVTFQVVVNDTIPLANPLLNTAVIDYKYLVDPLGAPIPGASIPTNQVSTQLNYADIILTKSRDKAYVDNNEQITYAIRVENTGNIDATNVVIKDVIPPGTTFVNDSVTVNDAPFIGSTPMAGITIALVASGQYAIVTFKVLVDSDSKSFDPILNKATATFTHNIDPNGTIIEDEYTESNQVSTNIRYAQIKAQKAEDKSYVDVGEEITYSITLNNVGNVPAMNMVFIDTIPVGTSFVKNSVSIDGTAVAGLSPLVGIPMSDLAVGSVRLITFKVLVDANVPTPNPMVNKGEVTFKYVVDPLKLAIVGETLTNGVAAQVNHAQIVATKNVDKTVAQLNDSLMYSIIISNQGNVDAKNVVCTDKIPSGTTFVAGSVFIDGVAHGTEDPENGILIGTVTPGNIIVVTFKVKVGATVPIPNPMPNAAFLNYNFLVDPTDTTPTPAKPVLTNKVYTLVQIAKLESVKKVDKFFADLGEVLHYTITLTNTGNATAQNVVLDDRIPVGSTLVPGSIKINGAIAQGVNSTIGVQLPDMVAGEVVMLEFDVSVNSTIPVSDPLLNEAITNYTYTLMNGGSPVNGDPSCSNQVSTVINNATVQINKQVDSNYKDINDRILYTFTVTNVGNVDAMGVVFTDLLQLENTFEVGSASINGVVDRSLNPEIGIPLGSMTPGEVITIAFAAKVVAIPVGNKIVNSANANYGYHVEPLKPLKYGVSTSNQTVVNVQHAEILPQNVIKSADQAIVTEQDTILYTIQVKNTGNVPANNVLVHDGLPAGITLVPGTIMINGITQFNTTLNGGVNIGTVLPGAISTLKFQVKVGADAPQLINNTAVVDYGYIVNPLKPPINNQVISNQVKVKKLTAQLDTVKSADQTVVVVGAIVTYTVVCKNNGDLDLSNVIVRDVLPSGLEFVTSSVSVDGFNKLTDDITAGVNIGIMTVGEIKTITFKAKVISDENVTVTNNVTATFSYKADAQGDEHTKQQLSNSVTITVQEPKLMITKVADKKTAVIGDKITYRVVIVNTGKTPLYDIVFRDNLPGSVELIPDTFTLNGVKVAKVDLIKGVSVGGLSQGAEVVIMYQVQVVSGSTDGHIINEAYATYRYELQNHAIGNGKTPIASADVEDAVTMFKQMTINRIFKIPSQKPDMEEMDDLAVEVEVLDHYVVKTAQGTSEEGQVLSGNKLIVHGQLRVVLEYTAEVTTQSMHSAHWSMPFTAFVILPRDYQEGQWIEVTVVVEDVEGMMLDERTIEANVILMVVAKIQG